MSKVAEGHERNALGRQTEGIRNVPDDVKRAVCTRIRVDNRFSLGRRLQHLIQKGGKQVGELSAT